MSEGGGDPLGARARGGEPLPPTLAQYAGLNAAVWAFLAAMAWFLAVALGSARSIIMMCIFLGGGFSAVSAFDYCWLRWGRRRGPDA